MKLTGLKVYRDRHGKWRIYVRATGRPLPVSVGFAGPGKPLPKDCLEFLAAYQDAMREPRTPLAPGAKWARHGAVEWLVTEFFASLDFRGRPKSVRTKHRRHCEAFRIRRGDRMVAGLKAEHFEKRLAAMLEQPAAANQWLDAMRDLMKFAVKRGIISGNPVADIKKRPSKNPDGRHTWTREEVARYRAHHAVCTKARLALELSVRLALRRSDVIRLGPPDVRDGVLDYIQHKMRERKPSRVVIDLKKLPDLVAIIRATPAVGIKTWLVDGHGKPFTEDAFSHRFAEQVKAAGLPARCTPHGLRKRCLTDMAERGCTLHEIMAWGGHLTAKEVVRYTQKADRTRNAAAAADKLGAEQDCNIGGPESV